MRKALLAFWPFHQSRSGKRRWLQNTLTLAGWLGRDAYLAVLGQDKDQISTTLAQVDHPRHFLRVVPLGHNDLKLAVKDLEAVCRAVDADLLVLPHPNKDESFLNNGWKPLVELASEPLVFLPVDTLLAPSPFSNVIVPISGEYKETVSLDIALQLAQAGSLPVDVIHVSPAICAKNANPLDSVPDQLALEYPARFELAIARESPLSTSRLRQHIRQIHHCCGAAFTEINRLAQGSTRPILVFEWAGTFGHEHGAIVKHTLTQTPYALILVRSPTPSASTLKVGERFVPGQSSVCTEKSKSPAPNGKGA